MLGGIDYHSIASAVRRALQPVLGTIGSNGSPLIADSTQSAGARWADAWSRGMLAGCQFTWVSTTSLTLGAGTCRDDADTETMKLASATTMSNLTVGWVVGNNQPKIRTGVALANGMTLHAYVIKRMDTGVVDWFLTDEASNPTLPANYTKSRRVASLRFGAGVQNFPQFIQNGDEFIWGGGPVVDVNAGNPGAAAVTRTLTLPTGVTVTAIVALSLSSSSGTSGIYAYLSDLATTDIAPAAGNAQLGITWAGVGNTALAASEVRVQTNTSAQIRSRLHFSDANVNLSAGTKGWIDRRGRDA